MRQAKAGRDEARGKPRAFLLCDAPFPTGGRTHGAYRRAAIASA
jgi:hypothetical protein